MEAIMKAIASVIEENGTAALVGLVAVCIVVVMRTKFKAPKV